MFWKFLKSTERIPDKANQPAKANHSSHLPLSFLQKLIPVGGLPEESLINLDITRRSFLPGQIIFDQGDYTDSLIYLYSGNVYLETSSGSGYDVDESTFKAYHPLSTNTEHNFRAIARTRCEIIYFPLSALKQCSNIAYINNPLVNDEDIPKDLAGSALFNGFCQAFRRDELRVPSLPDVAIRLRRALQQDISVADAAKIIAFDPVIASKLIQVVNSPLYRTANPIARCHDAVNRLGLKTTQNLVTSISLHHLFRSSNKHLNGLIQQLWKQSIQIASLSYTLADLTNAVNPDEALLAGLTYNIGALPIVTYAETLKRDSYTEQELEKTISVLQGLVGVFILKRWNFPRDLQELPMQASHWYHDENPTLQIDDIVLLARFHAYLSDSNKHQLPPLNTLPAFLKLGDNALTPDMSLKALHEAKHQIAETMSFFRT